MRHGVGLLVLGLAAAALGAASARADGGTTTTTPTTGTTTTPSYAPLSPSSLPAACVGAGAAAVAEPGSPVVALGTPASDLGPSVYASAAGPVLAFDSSAAGGSTCSSASVTLDSVSLFDGAVTASSVQATDGRGTVSGLEIAGSAVGASAGQTLSVEGWGQLTLGETAGRVTAPLVLRLLAAHDSLPAGTAIAVGFAASAQPVARPKPKHHTVRSSRSHAHPRGSPRAGNDRPPAPQKPPPDYPASAFPFRLAGGLARVAQDNAVVSIAMRYLGVPYKWGGATPKTGFDCSGLVQYVFAQLGVFLPHFAAGQWYSPDAVWVPPDRLQPGDLVFFTGSDGTRKEPGHVGIYVGDGYLIDAPHSGAVVQIDSLDERWFANKYVGAKRIVGASFGARHLLHVPKISDPTTALHAGFPPSVALAPLGESLGVAVAARAASHGYWAWAGFGSGGLLLALAAGTLDFRRRRPSDGKLERRRLGLTLSARPSAREVREAGCARPLDEGLDTAEDRSLGGGGDDDLAPATALVRRLRRLLLVTDGAPDALEDRTGDQAAEDADDQAERLVEETRHEHEPSRERRAAHPRS